MRYLQFVLAFVGLVCFASCDIVNIVGPARVSAGQKARFQVSISNAFSSDPYALCVQRPTGWTVAEPLYGIQGPSVSSGTLSSVNTTIAADLDTSRPQTGASWLCWNGPAIVSGDRGEVSYDITAGGAGTYELRFAVVSTALRSFATHVVTVDGVPRFDANAVVAGSGPPVGYQGLAYGNGVYVATTGSNFIIPNDGLPIDVDVGAALVGVTFASSKFVAVGTQRTIVSSTNGVDWSDPLTTQDGAITFYSVFRGATRFIVGGTGLILQSADGTTWSPAITSGLNPATVWFRGAAGGNREALVSIDGLNVAVAVNGGQFALATLPDAVPVNGIAFAEGTGWVLVRNDSTFLRSQDLVTFSAPQPLTPGGIQAFSTGGQIFVSGPGSLSRITASGVFPVGIHTSAFLNVAASDPNSIRMYGFAGPGALRVIIPIAHLAVDATTLAFTEVGQERTFNVRNEALGDLYVTGVTASAGSTVSGCSGAVLASGKTCKVTVTLVNSANPGTVTVTTNAATQATATVALTFTAPPDDGGEVPEEPIDNEDDGCAAAPGAPLVVLLVLFARRRREARLRSV